MSVREERMIPKILPFVLVLLSSPLSPAAEHPCTYGPTAENGGSAESRSAVKRELRENR